MTLCGKTQYRWSDIHKLGFTNKLFKLCRIGNNEMYAKVKTGKHLSSKLKVNWGLRQGDAIAPLLFNIVLEIAIGRSKVETGGNIFDICTQTMAYADDVVIMGKGFPDFEEVYTSLVEQKNKMGLKKSKEEKIYDYHESRIVKMNTQNLVHIILKQ
jgi:hypothetical protein